MQVVCYTRWWLSFQRYIRAPVVAVHGHRRLGPIPGEYAAVRGRLRAEPQRLAVVGVERSVRERVLSAAALPPVPGEEPRDESFMDESCMDRAARSTTGRQRHVKTGTASRRGVRGCRRDGFAADGSISSM